MDSNYPLSASPPLYDMLHSRLAAKKHGGYWPMGGYGCFPFCIRVLTSLGFTLIYRKARERKARFLTHLKTVQDSQRREVRTMKSATKFPYVPSKVKHGFKTATYAGLFASLLVLCCLKGNRDMLFQIRTPSSERCNEKLFWFTALTTVSSNEYWNYGRLSGICVLILLFSVCLRAPSRNQSSDFAVKVALLSARDKSPNLVPVLLLGARHGPADFEAVDNIIWFQQHGGIVCHHNLSFGADMQVR